MKGPKQTGLAISLDHPDISYFPGEVVSGKVTVLFQSVLKNISQLKLSIHVDGTASVFSGKKVKAKETYFTTDICLFENDNFRTAPTEDASFPFRFALPSNLPSSFSSKKGQVSYTVTALLKSSSLKETHPPHSFTVPFQVTGFVDLNREPRICEKATFSKAKTNGCFWGKNGPVGFKVTIPRKGFIPGETIPVSVEMTNTSKNNVKKTNVQLVQFVTCHSKSKSNQIKSKAKKPTENLVVEEVGPGIKPGGYTTWSCKLNIPKVPPTGLAGCKLIDVVYKLKFEMDLGGIHAKLSEETSILIGSIPIRTNSPELVPIDMIRSQLLNKVHSDVELDKKDTESSNNNNNNKLQMQRRVSFAVEEILSSENSSVSSLPEESSSESYCEEIEDKQKVPLFKDSDEGQDPFVEEDINNKTLGLFNFSTSYVRVFNNVPTTILAN